MSRRSALRHGRATLAWLLTATLLAGTVGSAWAGGTGDPVVTVGSPVPGVPAAWTAAPVPLATHAIAPGTPTASDSPPLTASSSSPPIAAVTPDPFTVPVTTPVPLQLPGTPPAAGRGTFSYDGSVGPVRGRAGELRRYRIAVENGAGEDITAFAVEVDRALGDPASWTGGGRLRLQRVPVGVAYDFTVYLATARTARRMCADGWVNIMVNGVPYTSCRSQGRVILNLDRWRLSVPHFVAAGVPLPTYRAYVVNHEVGHELGYRHEQCPGPGRAAPVMMQQTLFLKGCVANPWPYLAGRRHSGPAL